MAISQFIAMLAIMAFTSHKLTNKCGNKERDMVDSTGQYEDLKYLENKHGFSDEFMINLTSSPNAAKMQIQTYKNNMFIVCIISVLLGIILMGFAIACHEEWVGLIAGVIGSTVIFLFFYLYLHKRRAITATERIANYHGLI